MIKWIEWLLLLFVFFIPWNARVILRAGKISSGYWEYGTIALYATDVLFLVILVLGGILLVRYNSLQLPLTLRGRDRSFSPLKSDVFSRTPTVASEIRGVRGVMKVGIVFAFVGYIVLSIFWSPDKFVALYAVLKLFEGIVLFVLLRRRHSEVELPKGSSTSLFGIAFIASAVAQSVLAIVQFFTQRVAAWPWSGIAAKDPSELGVAVVQFADERWLRAYGSFPHPNLLGGFLVLALVITPFIPLILRGRRGSYLLLTAYYLLLITGIFFTFSRAAWIAAVVGVGIWFFTNGTWRNRLIQQMTLLLIAYSLLLTAIFFPLVRTRTMGTEHLEQRSTVERVSGYTEAWQLIQRHPFFGVGVGNYTKAVHDEIRPNDPSWSYQPIHNVFVLILAELGFVGILFFITPFIPLILRGRRGSYLLFVPLVILMSLDHSFWTLHPGILVFWAFLALSGDFHRHSTGASGAEQGAS